MLHPSRALMKTIYQAFPVEIDVGIVNEPPAIESMHVVCL